MYLLIIGWLYVALMMAVAEAANPAGTVLGAVITFVLYGVGPVALLTYLLGWPSRRIRREQAAASVGEQAATRGEESAADAAATRALVSGSDADRGGDASADPVTPVRKEP